MSEKLSDTEWFDLIFRGINDLDSNSLNYIKNCKKLSLSSNFIKMLKELWISYYEIEKLDWLKSLIKLEKLHIGNNLIWKIDELNSLSNLPELKDVVFKGNPFTLENPSLWNSKPQDRNPIELYPEIQKKLPNVQIIDGNTV